MLGSKTFRVWFVATLLMCAISCSRASKAQEVLDYRIAPGDVVQIDVWEEPGITRTIPVRPDGKISLPLLNDVQAAGLTAMQLAGAIRDGLVKYLANAQVTVAVTGIPPGTKFLTTPRPVPPLKVPPPLSPDLKQKCCVA
jgi:protein involved in polysaccharide export with SLBB domain